MATAIIELSAKCDEIIGGGEVDSGRIKEIAGRVGISKKERCNE